MSIVIKIKISCANCFTYIISFVVLPAVCGDILQHVKMFAILILDTLIFRSGDNIEILPKPN